MGMDMNNRDEMREFLSAFGLSLTGNARPVDLLYGAQGMDTIQKAVEEKRCIKEPVGCGQQLLDENGHPKFIYEDSETANLYYREWTITGLCGTCQDKVQATAEALQGECCGNSPCTCEEAPSF